MAAIKTSPESKAQQDKLEAMRIAIYAVISPVFDADLTKTAAQDAAQEAIQGASTAREDALCGCAKLAHAGGWLPADVDTAVTEALRGANTATEKAKATFASEMRTAMNPNVREWLPGMRALRDEVWNAEDELLKTDKEAVVPLHKGCNRKYHALVQMSTAGKAGTYFSNAAALIAWAKLKDPAIDAAKTYANVKKAMGILKEAYSNFPVNALKTAYDVLADEVSVQRMENSVSRPNAPPVPVVPQVSAHLPTVVIAAAPAVAAGPAVAPAAPPALAPVVAPAGPPAGPIMVPVAPVPAPVVVATNEAIDDILADFNGSTLPALNAAA